MAIDTNEKTLAWLRRFGYVLHDNPTDDEIAAAVRKMQSVYGLRQDGVPGPITRRAMGLFRCSQRDTNIVMADTQAAARTVAVGTTCRWRKTDISFAVTPDFALAGDRETCLAIIRQGFKYYEPLTGLTFTETEDLANADIQIGVNSSAALNAGNVGNVLAVSGLPCGGANKLKSTFDREEPWNLQQSGAGVIFTAVWMHELGHLIGLTHTSDPGDLMSPYYDPNIIYPQSGDRQRIAALYGVPYVDTSDNHPTTPNLGVGAYSITGILVVRHDGGVAINVKNITQVGR